METPEKEKTEQYPEGKLVPKDEGKVEVSIGTAKDNVIISFPKSIMWIAMNKNQAIDFAALITKTASTIKS